MRQCVVFFFISLRVKRKRIFTYNFIKLVLQHVPKRNMRNIQLIFFSRAPQFQFDMKWNVYDGDSIRAQAIPHCVRANIVKESGPGYTMALHKCNIIVFGGLVFQRLIPLFIIEVQFKCVFCRNNPLSA